MSAWIEMMIINAVKDINLVALYMSAWIEIRREEYIICENTSRTLYECVD